MDENDCPSRINTGDKALELHTGHGKNVVDGEWGRRWDVETGDRKFGSAK